MTLSTATSTITKAEERLRDMLAACGPFQEWCGVLSGSEAKERIHLSEVSKSIGWGSGDDGTYTISEARRIRPFALVWTGETESFAIDLVAAPATPNPSGTLHVRFEENIDETLVYNYPEAYRRFLNAIGRILQSGEPNNPGLVELAGQSHVSFLALQRIALSVSPVRTTETDRPTLGDAQMCQIAITWGAVS